MRWWHYKLLPVLPKKQKIGQWREVVASVGGLEKFGVLDKKHGFGLLKHINELTREDFKKYISLVWNNFEHRTKTDKLTPLIERIDKLPQTCFGVKKLNEIHTTQYLNICYHNLLEKSINNLITEDDMLQIDKVYHNLIEEKI